MSKGTLLVVSGPSGVGKTTIAKKLREAGIPRVMTTTTRAPRGTEKNGVEYRFLSRAEFEADLAQGKFLESAEIDGNLYGTPKERIEQELASRKVVLVDIDTQGAATLRKMGVPAMYVFIAPPDMACCCPGKPASEFPIGPSSTRRLMLSRIGKRSRKRIACGASSTT